MDTELSVDYNYIAKHIKDYIEQGNLFDIFNPKDLNRILEKAKLTSDDFITLINQSLL